MRHVVMKHTAIVDDTIGLHAAQSAVTLHLTVDELTLIVDLLPTITKDAVTMESARFPLALICLTLPILIAVAVLLVLEKDPLILVV